MIDVFAAWWATNNKKKLGSAIITAAILGSVGAVISTVLVGFWDTRFSAKEIAIRSVGGFIIHGPLAAIGALVLWRTKLKKPESTISFEAKADKQLTEVPAINPPSFVSSKMDRESPAPFESFSINCHTDLSIPHRRECQVIDRELEDLIREFRLSQAELSEDGSYGMNDIKRKFAATQRANDLWEKLAKISDNDASVLFLWCKLHCCQWPPKLGRRWPLQIRPP